MEELELSPNDSQRPGFATDMPQFQRKSIPFICRGMNLTGAPEDVPDGQFRLLYNVRYYNEGLIDSRPGVNAIGTVPGGNYIHSGFALLDLDPNSTGGNLRILGADTGLYSTALTMAPGAPSFIEGGFSGNPLSMVPFRPEGSPVSWLYVADSAKMRKVSASSVSAGIPIPYQIGIPQINFAPQVLGLPAGDLTGDYSWLFVLRHAITGSQSSPGPATYTPETLAAQKAFIANPNLAGYSADFIWDLYRFGGAANQWQLVASMPNGPTGFSDNLSDADALASTTLLTDAASIPHQPWVTPDVPRNGTCTTAAATALDGSAVGAGGEFNTKWLNGTTIVINNVACTIRRVVSAALLYVEEDLGVLVNVVWRVDSALQYGQPLPHMWGPFGAGQFGAYMFGCGDPVQSGVLYWTNGNDPDSMSAVNTLEITSPSEPLQNGCIYNGRCYVWSTQRMFVVTPDLVNAGQFVAQVIPGARGLWAKWALAVGDYMYFRSVDGIFKSDGSTCVSITDRDLYPLFPHDSQPPVNTGVYDPDDSDGSGNYSFIVYPPYDGYGQYQRLTYSNGILYYDYRTYAGHSLCLVCDTKVMQGGWSLDSYITATNNFPVGRWMEHWYSAATSVDRLSYMIFGFNTILCIFDGQTDLGAPIISKLQTRAEALGDLRGQKLIGDAILECNPVGVSGIKATVIGSFNAITLGSGVVSSGGGRTYTIIDVNAGLGTLDRSVGMHVAWSTDTSSVELYGWEPSYVPKPEITNKRATDWDDDGTQGAKYLKGCVIHANVSVSSATDLAIGAATNKVSSATITFVAAHVGSIIQITDGTGWTTGTFYIESVAAGVATLDRSPAALGTVGGSFSLAGSRTVQVQYDSGSIAGTITLAAPGESELPYSFTPVVAHMMRLVPTDSSACQLFKVQWIWDQYPEYLTLTEDYYLDKWPSGKYIRGVVLEGDTMGATVVMNVQYDGTTSATTLSVTQSGKTMSTYAFATPFLANEVRIVPTGRWRRHSIRWIFDEYPDFAQLITPWTDGGFSGVKYLRAVRLKVDTAGANLSVALQGDGGSTLYTITGVVASGQKTLVFALNAPVPAYLLRLVPNGTWRFWSAEYIYDQYPDLVGARTSWEDGGVMKPKYFRGVNLRADTNNVSIPVIVETDEGTFTYTIPAVQHNGQAEKNYPFSTPFIAYMVRLCPQGAARIWPTGWIYDVYPDLSTQQTGWTDLGYIGAKFLQGVELTADTSNIAQQFRIDYDEGAVVTTTPTTAFNGQVTKPFSWDPVIVHNVRVVPLGNARVFEDRTRWIWEPAPDLAKIWQTQETTFDIPGFTWLRDCLIAYVSTDTVNLAVVTDGVTTNYTLPSTGGAYAKAYFVLAAHKGHARYFKLTSDYGFRLYQKDCEVRVKAWGAPGPFMVRNPFGDVSRVTGATI